tara:strand:- start:137 stop:358 length:222 start_codon:yes stop_codon:yes gene_type:complete
MNNFKPMQYAKLALQAREIAEYALILQGFAHIDHIQKDAFIDKSYHHFKGNYESQLQNKIDLFEQYLKDLNNE